MMSEYCVEPKASSQKAEIDWRRVGQLMLKQSLPINPFTTLPEELETEWENLNLTLGLVDRNKKEFLSSRSKLEITQRYTQEQFFSEIIQQQKSKSKGRRLAIIGLSGTGKTIFLQNVASWILKNTEDIPIWISLSEVGQLSLKEYLLKKWLPRAKKTQPYILFDWASSFETLLNSQRVWLLLDGVDEMGMDQVLQQQHLLTETPILSPLSIINQQLQGWGEQAKIILSSRNYVWEADKNLLFNFDIFYTLALNNIDEIKHFVKKCFAHFYFNSKSSSWQEKTIFEEQQRHDLPQQLCNALDQFGQERIKELINTPLRIALLCRFWYQHNPHFPKTSTELYQELVTEFYQWQAEKVTTTLEMRTQLNQFLGKLALKAMQKKRYFTTLENHLIIEESEQNAPLFQLAVKIGWLKLLGVVANQINQKIYTFLDNSFQNYLAALAIPDWRFFWSEELASNSLSSDYPVFNQNWKNTILFWLGRDDILKIEKEALIRELMNFQDKCSSENYYGKLAYFLAAAGLTEFAESENSEKIINRLIQWSFDAYHYSQPMRQEAKKALSLIRHPKATSILINLLTSTEQTEIQEQIFQCLEKLGRGNTSAILALQEIIKMPSTYLQWQGAEILGKIDSGNQQAIETLIRLIDLSPQEELRQTAFNSLEKIGQGNPKIITTVIRQIQATDSPITQRRAFECLEKIGQENATAIASLVQLIRTTQNLSIRRQAAESLEKIDPSNPTALAVLIQLLQDHSEEIRQQAVYSLGELSSGNPEAIEALSHLLSSNQTILTQWLAVSSLGKIGMGSQAVINTLVRLVQSNTQLLLRKDAIESLSKIAPNHPVAINTLVELMEKSEDEATRREVAESLGRIDLGNPEAIKALVHLIHSSQDEFTKRQAAVSLSKIDSGNLEALWLLIQQAKSSQDKDIRSLAAESLGEIGQSNPAAIAALIRLITPSQDTNTLKKASHSLGKIALGNKEAIAVLLKLLQFSEDQTTRIQASESLIAILLNSQLADLITHLKPFLYDPKYHTDLACQKIIWHCIQQMTYPEFYQAWHHTSLSKAPKNITLDIVITPPVTPPSFSQQLSHLIKEDPLTKQKIHLICIDSNDLIDTSHPLVDIYDQMLQQKCPPFEHGIPETMAKLRLYWNTLCRSQIHTEYLWVFYDASTNPLTQEFWQSLDKFQGLICGVTEHSLTNLKQFSPNEPEVCQKILQWIKRIVDTPTS